MKKKYLAYYENEWPANITELTAVENKPFVGYLKDVGVQFTVIPAPVEGPSANEIWYKSINNEKLEFILDFTFTEDGFRSAFKAIPTVGTYKSSQFGEYTITSHEYDPDLGWVVIRFEDSVQEVPFSLYEYTDLAGGS